MHLFNFADEVVPAVEEHINPLIPHPVEIVVGFIAFTLLFLSYLISLYRESLGDLDGRPMTAALYLVATTSSALLIYLLTAALLGVDVPPALRAGIDTAGNAIWTLLLSPLYFPLINRLKLRLFAIGNIRSGG